MIQIKKDWPRGFLLGFSFSTRILRRPVNYQNGVKRWFEVLKTNNVERCASWILLPDPCFGSTGRVISMFKHISSRLPGNLILRNSCIVFSIHSRMSRYWSREETHSQFPLLAFLSSTFFLPILFQVSIAIIILISLPLASQVWP